ncbi:MAG: HPr family phosphocarrier protein [Lachnospiraceae bacterium]|jgi:catabolite repression HPr-like protein|nr:HPr family phosphocarrier protein [Lachnospiraceae bacterium]MBO6153880.1 HPr family phosphocarrier protein [Lachnospiraceae bacterium]MBQ2089664.1 HPr family phosphocarrier protein [Lachnospiraceae bacterium]MBQ4300774.1 HPr family phosphocarrier protein [Lachnospiraceae bacterium]MBR1571861.1 HPr family phosphocarrier protein [Lachnospiraceae bacterium]
MKKEVTITMKDTMEATPIAQLVSVANQYSSQIYLEMDSARVNAKSIMGMMSMVFSTGSVVTIDAEGDDEATAIVAIEEFLTA